MGIMEQNEIKRNNICIMVILEEEEKEEGTESIFKITMGRKLPKPEERKGYPNLWGLRVPQMSETESRATLRHTIIKLSKAKNRKNFKNSKRKKDKLHIGLHT